VAPGVGASGILGIAIEDLLEPVFTSATPSTTGGTITAGTYRYAITAINAVGETLSSNEISGVVTTGSTSSVALIWVAVTGATGYNLYKTAAGGGAGTELKYKTVGLVTTDTDTSPGAPTGALPTSNTAFNPGVYVPPTKFVPFESENLTSQQSTIWRRPIRQSADVIGAVPGNFHVAGEVNIEYLEDCSVYFLSASRTSIVKSGSAPNFIYTITPTSAATPTRTLSITVVRNGIVFGFVGCVVSSQTMTVSDGILMHNIKIIGRDEAVQSVPTPTWPTTVPFGAGQYSIEIPTATPVTDTDTFDFTIDDTADAQFRLKSTGRGAQFIKYGERKVDLSLERDFDTRTDFDNFKALTSDTMTLTATKGANNSVSVLIPISFKDTYEVHNAGQGELVRAAIKYVGAIDGTGKSYQITLKTQESI